MGALLFENKTYHETLPIVDASGLSVIPFTNISDGRNWLYDLESGHVQQAESSILNLTKTPKFQAEIKRYVEFWNTEFKPLAVVGYKVRLYYSGFQLSVLLRSFDWFFWCRMVSRDIRCRLLNGCATIIIHFCFCSSSRGWFLLAMATLPKSLLFVFSFFPFWPYELSVVVL